MLKAAFEPSFLKGAEQTAALLLAGATAFLLGTLGYLVTENEDWLF
ncbi:MAG: hypothetical protein R8M38_00185 [Mariprofundaceae bacterium]